VRQQRDLPCSLDGGLQRALVPRARARDAPRLNLAALGDEGRQELDVLVADVVDLIHAELAHATAPEESAPAAARRPGRSGRRLAHRSPPALSTASSLAASLLSSSFGCSPSPAGSSLSGGSPRRLRRSPASALRR